MAIVGFIFIFIILAWCTLFSLAMIFGSLAFSGVWKNESTLGVVILCVVIIGWINLFNSAPFTLVIT